MYVLQSREARAAHRVAVLGARPRMSARIGVGMLAASWNMAALRAAYGLDASLDELVSDVLGGQVFAGDAAGEKPGVGAAGVGGLPATG